ncbi:porin [Nitrosomonas sp. JL21]|uniref:OprO/OprP family phosphate-selective porin n=1 Tax=Nitrosomonas sp. JL21 TaxID=153949 RepID=UPI00136B336D|nr:porin [Nitrosomonas sp. JL21]MBL8497845.1 porin [Nitrosomonas sp.]MCC7091886.1 porin [Nitrosomonas sp.]MXS76792.1 porin [Nitrosomonas sp. JL21]
MRYCLKFSSSVILAYFSIASCYAANFSGLKLKSTDGNVEFALNGRGHFDVHSLYPDTASADYPAFGSQLLSSNDRDGFNWRRTYATLTGKIYGVNFKFENDFAVNATTEFPHSLREAWVSTKLGPGQLTVGQFKPYRGMEEITSSNELTLMERPSTSSTGIYSGRQFLTGLGYRALIKDNIGLGIYVMSLSHFGLPIEGISYGGRAVWLPIDQAGHILHLGLSLSRDTANKDSISAKAVDVYGGRQGISQSLGTAGAASGSPNQSTISAELAYSIGSATLQSEYALSRLDHTHSVGKEAKDSTIQAFYLQGSWFVTGEHVVYKKDRGAFGKPKPTRKWGALELAGRYDFAENLQQSLIADPCRTSTSKCQVQVITFGVNWYPTPNVRFMLNYYISEAMLGTSGLGAPSHKDHLSALSFRTQINF